jgi:hypothetical protein
VRRRWPCAPSSPWIRTNATRSSASRMRRSSRPRLSRVRR